MRRLLRAFSRQLKGSRPDPQSKDVFADGLYPICPATHDLGIRRLFDLSTLLLLLDCKPGDRVLDLGAGPGFASETMARLGYDVVAIDPDARALAHNRRRIAFDPTRIDGAVHVGRANAEQLPFRDSVFDGVLGMNVLHHISDITGVVREIGRVLKAGCRAVFVEPGLRHLQSEEAQRARREHGENDRPFDVIAFLHHAKSDAFEHAMLTATLHPPLRLLPIEELDLYLSGKHPRSFLTPGGVIAELRDHHAYCMLQRKGHRQKTSRNPGVLRCDLSVGGVPEMIRAGGTMALDVVAVNTGDTTWLATPSRLGGFVTFGCKLLTPEGRLWSDTCGRTCLPGAVPPGERARLTAKVTIPDGLPPGEYRIAFDLVDELICWFSEASGVPRDERPIRVV